METSKRNNSKRRILIVGGGIIGLSTAYFWSKYAQYDITVIDKDTQVRGASAGNAGTITLSSFNPWTTVNFWTIIKENIFMREGRDANLKFTLIFNSSFRKWLFYYLKNRDEKSIERGNKAILSLGQYSMKLFDFVVNEVTENPLEIEYHQEPFISTHKNVSETKIQSQVKEHKRVKEHGSNFIHLQEESSSLEEECSTYFERDHKSGLFKTINAAYLFTCHLINPLKFWDKIKIHLENKKGVKFINGTLNNMTHENGYITGINYTKTEQGKTLSHDTFDDIVIWGGIGSLFLGKLIGIEVPIQGFKGHSLDIHLKKDPEAMEYIDQPTASYAFNPENVWFTTLGRDNDGLVRVTGYSDLVGNDTQPIPERKQELIKRAKELFGEDAYDESTANHWVGLRPVSADDIPIIGQSSKFKNLYWNTGHGARGVTFSLGSGKILGHLINHDEIENWIDTDLYDPGRFSM